MEYCSERGGNASILIENKRESDAPRRRPVCGVSPVRKSFPGTRMEVTGGVNMFCACAPSHHHMHKDKTVCAVWLYFNAIRSQGYIGTFLRHFFCCPFAYFVCFV